MTTLPYKTMWTDFQQTNQNERACNVSSFSIACSRHSDHGDSTKRCEQKKKSTRGWGRGESKFPPLSLSLFSTLLFSCSLHSGHTLPSEHLEQATLSGSLRTYTFHQVHVQLSIPILFQPKKHLRTLMPRHLHGVDKSCTQSVINEE